MVNRNPLRKPGLRLVDAAANLVMEKGSRGSSAPRAQLAALPNSAPSGDGGERRPRSRISSAGNPRKGKGAACVRACVCALGIGIPPRRWRPAEKHLTSGLTALSLML
jgi:hypothetical protein